MKSSTHRISLGRNVAAAALVSGLVVVWGNARAAAPAGEQNLCPGGKITIGAAKALSGGFSFFDAVGNKADQLAIDLVNQEGGINGCKLELITKDTKSDPAVGAQVARELLRTGVQILLVPNDQDVGMPAAQVAARAGIFSLSPGGASDSFGAAVGPLFANGGTTSAQNAYAAVQFAKSKGYQSVYYVTLEQFAYFTLMEKNFGATSGLKQLGRSVVTAGQTDFSAVVSAIKRSIAGAPNPVIYAATMYPDAPTLVKQLREAGVDTPIIGNAAFSSPDLPKALGGRTKDVYYAAGTYYEGDDAGPGAKKFVAAYKQKYEVFPPNLNAPESYWTMWALFDAIKSANSLDGKAIAKALFAQKNLELPLKTLGRWEHGHIVGSTVVIGFTADGKFKEVASYKAPAESGGPR